jgi:hypothetical protein
MDDDWLPTESDCQWTHGLLEAIEIGGQWRTSYAIYVRTGEREITLLAKIFSPETNTEPMIVRTKKAIELSGWTYTEDKDLMNIILPFAPVSITTTGDDFIAYKDGEPVRIRLKKCTKCGFWHNIASECLNCKR